MSEGDLIALISSAIKRKKKQHAGKDLLFSIERNVDILLILGMLNLSRMENRPMILIGG